VNFPDRFFCFLTQKHMDNKNARIPLGFYKIPPGLSEEELSKLSEAIYHDVRKKIKEKTLCHLLQNDEVEYYTDLHNSLEEVKEYIHESHLWRHLKRCKECGQLFLFEFYEWVDWENGNDPQYDTWIPVKNIHEADKLNKLTPTELNAYFGLHRDWPSTVPVAPDHAKLCHKPKGENEKFLIANCSAMDIYKAEMKNVNI